MSAGLTAYAAICFGLVVAATSYFAPNFAKAVANAAIICGVVALLFVAIPIITGA
jgi:hypothetical protein